MRHLKLAPNWLRFLIVVVLVIGVFFRFFNLDNKVYGHDETYTSLRISGYTTTEVRRQIFNGRVINSEAFAKFQRINPEKSLGDTVKSLAIEDPQHPPLYYLIARLWAQIFGTSVTAIRSLSVIISLLVFPCVYWLCRELFNVPFSVPFLAIALIAISPVHLIYAQEAREYTLWVVTILLSSASLLQALQLESKQRIPDRMLTWGIYTLTLALSLYTSLLSGFIAVAHGIYVMTTTGFRWTKKAKLYTLASLAGFLAFTPWILVILTNLWQFQRKTAGTTGKLSPLSLIQTWLIQLSRIFFDFNFGSENPFSYSISYIFLILVGYSIYILCRTTHPKIWLFIVLLIAVPALPLMLPDLIFGGTRSTAEQYLIPSYLGIKIAVAYLFAYHLYDGILLLRRIWQTILVLVIMSGVISCAVSSLGETWWNKGVSYGHPQVVKIINQASRPLLISDSFGINYGNVFSLSYLVEPKVRFLLMKDRNIPKIPKGFTDVFLLNPSRTLRQGIENKYKSKINRVYSNKYYSLWKLAKPLTKKYTLACNIKLIYGKY
ncbi:glycosyltransferase family 39 protein [Mastigocladopsis repens]|uniref:glycosyltransferase family 39 protein n=1 Tax=Mastigocladopsis repens TaxID=221287 RepID=UPI0002E9A8AC|nr:glycosyltransferase family 39 protein [Mastigocladopsis repens]